MTIATTGALIDSLPIVVHLAPAIKMSDREFFKFCQQNSELRIERTAEGVIEIMPPVVGGGSSRNAQLTSQLTNWSNQNNIGVAFDATGGFKLPNGATRSPDAAWVLKSRLAQLPADVENSFIPLCPDFVVELRSPSDALSTLQDKLKEYIANGSRLGWLIDPRSQQVWVYRPGKPVETLISPTTVAGDPELPGFTLDLARIWDAGFR